MADISLSPSSIQGYLLSENGASNSFTVSNTGDTPDYVTYWEADATLIKTTSTETYKNGLIGTTATLTTIPRSIRTTVRAYRVLQMVYGDSVSPSDRWNQEASSPTTPLKSNPTGSFGVLTSPASGVSSWNCWARTSSGDAVKVTASTQRFFIESRPLANNKECAFGFVVADNTTGPVLPTPSPDKYKYAFHFKTDGTYQILINGSAVLTAPAHYKGGDAFRVEKSDSSMKFSHNGAVVYKALYTNDASKPSYYPAQSFNSNSCSLYHTVVYGHTTATKNSYYVESSPIQIYGLCPGQPQYSYKINKDNITLASQAEDGSSVFRKKSKARITMSLQYNQRSFEEFKEMMEFWSHHERHIPFIYRDIGPYDSAEHRDYLVRFENQLEYTIEGPNSVTWSLALREV